MEPTQIAQVAALPLIVTLGAFAISTIVRIANGPRNPKAIFGRNKIEILLLYICIAFNFAGMAWLHPNDVNFRVSCWLSASLIFGLGVRGYLKHNRPPELS